MTYRTQFIQARWTLAVASLLLAGPASAVTVYLENGQFSSTTMTNGNGDETALDQGWYAKNADNGVQATINWSAGATVGTPGILTQVGNSGSATRFGQFTTINLSGTGWTFQFDLGETGSLNYLRLWAGTLAANPSGTAISTTGDTTTPPDSLVDANGWTQLVNTGAIAGASGTQSYAISQDLGDYDVVIIQVRGNGPTVGTTYDNFAFTNPIPEPSAMALMGLGAFLFGRRRR